MAVRKKKIKNRVWYFSNCFDTVHITEYKSFTNIEQTLGAKHDPQYLTLSGELCLSTNGTDGIMDETSRVESSNATGVRAT